MFGTPDDGAEPDSGIAAFGPDGHLRAGWPVSVPARSRYLLGPQGTVVVWSLLDDVGELCVDPRRTVFRVLGPDGRTFAGWPRGSTGHASFPAVGADGTVYYVSATYRVYSHDLAGEVRTGWPQEVPGAGNGCGPEGPSVAPDGTIFVVGDEVTALSPDGRSPSGWPYRPNGSLVGPCLDSECYSSHAAPAFGPDGTVYLVVYDGEPGDVTAAVVAVDRQGRLKPGWPYRLPIDVNTMFVIAEASPDGRLIVRGSDSSSSVLLAVEADGRLAR